MRALARTAAAALGLAAAAAAPAHANGRFPASTSVTVRPGAPDELFLAWTRGMLISRDDGSRWYWLCEESIGYGGDFDPKYAVDAAGTLYATTYEGLRVSRDGGCTFETAGADQPDGPDRLGTIWVDAIDVASDGTVWVGTAESGLENAVFASTDQGRTFVRKGLVSATAWWKSVVVAPSNPSVVYVSGYQIAPKAAVFLHRSTDGGQSWSELPVTELAVGSQPLLLVAGVDPQDPDVVYVRSVRATAPSGDRLYRSADGGQAWTPVLDTAAPLRAVVVRASGEVLAGTAVSDDPIAGCTYRSSDRGQTFGACDYGPQMACATERSDGQLLACGANWEPDYFTLGRSTDGERWSKVLRFHELAGPLDCPAGTIQHDTCAEQLWPTLAEQFGVTGPVDAGDTPPPVDAPGPAASPEGCCGAGAGGAGPAALAALATLGLAGRRRRRATPRRQAAAPGR